MRLAEPQSMTEGNVAIFSLGEQRMFLPISEGYQDMLRRVVEDFDLEEDVVLSLRTSTMGICRGREVVIPESAYIYLWKHLDEVDVSIVGRAQVGRRQQKRAQEKSRAISPIVPEYLSSPFKDIETEAASSTVIHAEAPLDEERSHTPIPDDGVGRGVAGSSKVADMTEEKVEHSQKSKNADDEHHTSSKVADMTGETVAHSQKSKNADDEHSDDQPSQEKAVHVPLKIADLRPITEPQDSGEGKFISQKKFKPTVALFPKSNKDIGSPVTVKKEIQAEPGNEEPVTVKTNTLAPQPEEDPRFEITIVGPQNETAQFKTRGRHPVRKVLAAACKTFGIKARLILCVSTEEGGEIQTDEFDCPAGETMSQCGVDGNAKLFVRVQPDLDDEVYEED